MKRVHLVGGRNHGKTTFLVELIAELVRRGVAVGAIKHTSHRHTLDTPGKDSYRHRESGADPAALLTGEGVGVFLRLAPTDDPYQRLETLYADCDLVLVEGDLSTAAIKIEVYRRDAGGTPLALERPDILAVVSDDAPAVSVPVWPRRDVRWIADRVVAATMSDLRDAAPAGARGAPERSPRCERPPRPKDSAPRPGAPGTRRG